MVQVKYKGQNLLFVGSYKIKAGWNEIKDEDFYRLMATKLFKYRVDQKILEVEPGFPLEKPPALKPTPSPASTDKPVESEEKEDGHDEKLSIKGTLKLIDKSDDADYLQDLIDNDGRGKVVEEARKKLKSIK